MALSGQTGWIGKWQDTHRYFLDWTATQNIAANQSTITIRLRLQLLSNAGSYGTGSVARAWNISCGGQSRSGQIPTNTTLSPGNTYTLATTTVTLTHNADGTLSFSLSGNCDTPGGGGYAYIPASTFELDPIPRGMVSIRAATTAGASVRGQLYVRAASTAGAPTMAKEVWIRAAATAGAPTIAT